MVFALFEMNYRQAIAPFKSRWGAAPPGAGRTRDTPAGFVGECR
jgi:hypothetical protein